jgi:hypothetical protein
MTRHRPDLPPLAREATVQNPRRLVYYPAVAQTIFEVRPTRSPRSQWRAWVDGQAKSRAYPRFIATDLCDLYLKFSLEAAQIMPHYSARAILHRVRWKETIERRDPTYYVNSTVTPWLSRWAMWREPTLWDLRDDGSPFFFLRVANADYGPYTGNDTS